MSIYLSIYLSMCVYNMPTLWKHIEDIQTGHEFGSIDLDVMSFDKFFASFKQTFPCIIYKCNVDVSDKAEQQRQQILYRK